MSFISKRYAQALFELSLESQCLDQVSQDLTIIENVIKTVPEFKKFMDYTFVTKDQLQQFFQTFVTTQTFSKITINFLNLVGLKKRQNYLRSMIADFEEIVHNFQSKAKVQLTTAYPLSSEQHDLLIETLEKHFNKRMMVEEIVDPTLISGVVIDCEGFQIDTSIKTQLAQWQNEIRL
ncbi:MAG: ATP synthase F1 subunit delta [Janthinobacterium lividum]